MKTINEITNIISKQIGEAAKNVSLDYTIIVCSERIFVDDYLEQRNQRVDTNEAQIPYLGDDIPNDTYYSKTIFVVVKVGGGQRNMAVSNTDVTIDVISEEDSFDVARSVLEEFVVAYNFKYADGIAQAYFNPSVNSSQDSIYTGFRALMSVRGFVRAPENGLVFVSGITVGIDDGEGNELTAKVPFINLSDTYNGQPDPQAFAGYGGRTMALIRQSTETVTFSTYLFVYSESDWEGLPEETQSQMRALSAFSSAVIGAGSDMNRKFHIRMETPFADTPLVDDYFVFVGRNYSQELAGMDAFGLSFTMAKSVEE